MILSFQLGMPNVGSWNGKWTGADRKYFVVRNVSKRWIENQPHFEKLVKDGRDGWYYNFGDGWGASVDVEIIDGAEARRRRKVSAGFCGYEWMITSIMHDGKIHTGKVTVEL